METIEDKSWGVYIYRSPSNKTYIGITCKTPENRWKNGNGYLRKNKNGEYKQPLIANAINKYGWSNFEHIIWAENLTQKQACVIEKMLIGLFKTNCNKYGYNIRDGGDASRLSEETRKKISEAKKGKLIGGDGHNAKAVIRLLDKKIYGCMDDAAKDNHACRNTMWSYCQKHKGFMYYDEYICTQEVAV